MSNHNRHFEAGAGWAMDGDWLSHLSHCQKCRQFVPDKPATAAEMCLDGAVLYKRDNQTRPKAAAAQREETYATKAQVKAAMRYKE